MVVEQKTCTLYVDYEGLLVSLSRVQYFNIDALLGNLLEKAQQRFFVQKAVVLGDWMYHSGSHQLEERGFLCRTISASGPAISQVLQAGIAENLAANNAAEVYILVNGVSDDYNAVLRLLRENGRESILWTLIPPSSNDLALCSRWEPIEDLSGSEIGSWPYQMMLQAIAVTADHLQSDVEGPFLMSQLSHDLALLPPFSGKAEIWLAIAIREQILLQQRPEDSFDVVYGYLNRQHAIVKKALLIRERILVTLAAMLVKREWVAFGAIEKGLRTARLLAGSQRVRHAWLELLTAQGILIAGQVSQPDGTFQVTTLCFNQEHSLVTTLQDQQTQNLIRLIVAASNFMSRKDYPWIAVANLLRILTGVTTRIEARSVLSTAEQQGIIEIDEIAGKRNPALLVTIARLQQKHAQVQETLLRRDQLIALIHTILTDRNITGVSESVLVEEFVTRSQLQKSEALFWIRLLVNEGILSKEQILPGSDDIAQIMQLTDRDPVVDQILASISQQRREAK
jgi:hypothetical protein